MVSKVSPQLENGFTTIANELMEILARCKFNGTQRRILDVIIRYTYGFKKTEADFAINFLLMKMGMEKSQFKQVKRELDKLIEENVLIEICKPTTSSSRILRFNKYYDQWTNPPSGLNRPVVELDQREWTKKTSQPVVELDHHINKTKKENFKESVKKKYTEEFELFYLEYPRPQDKNRSFNNWKTCLKEYTVDQLMISTKNYKTKVKKEGTELKYIKTSANFLGKEKPFEDYLNIEEELKAERKPFVPKIIIKEFD